MRARGLTVIYGGSFNPPHVAHQMACLYLLEAWAADAVWLMPAFVHRFGKPLLAFEHRVEMCRRLAAPLGPRVDVTTSEAVVGSGRTYDVLQHLRASHPERAFALCIGADILDEVGSWYRWSDIEAMVPVLVLGRAGFPRERASPVALPAVSSTMVRQRVSGGQPVDDFLPAGVAAYVVAHGLYRG